MWHIEDDENDAFLVQRAITQIGHVKFAHFPSAELARQKLEVIKSPRHDLPHLILCDYKLPGMTGIDFAKWLRSSPCHCLPLVMLSSSALEEDILRAHDHGVSSFITKPLTGDQLKQVLQTLLSYWRDTCHSPVDYQPL